MSVLASGGEFIQLRACRNHWPTGAASIWSPPFSYHQIVTILCGILSPVVSNHSLGASQTCFQHLCYTYSPYVFDFGSAGVLSGRLSDPIGHGWRKHHPVRPYDPHRAPVRTLLSPQIQGGLYRRTRTNLEPLTYFHIMVTLVNIHQRLTQWISQIRCTTSCHSKIHIIKISMRGNQLLVRKCCNKYSSNIFFRALV